MTRPAPKLAAIALMLALSSTALPGCSLSSPVADPAERNPGSGTGRSSTAQTPNEPGASPLTARFESATDLAIAVHPAGDTLILSIQGTLFELPAAGGQARAITDYYQDAREPGFSPDGAHVVYHGYSNGTWDIFQLHLASGKISQLTSSPFDDREPVVSPDGRRLAFSSDRSGNYDLWELTLATGALRQLTTSELDDYSPSYHASGQQLIYARHIQRGESELRLLELPRPGADPAAASGDTSLAREPGVISGVSAAPAATLTKPPGTVRVSYQLLRRDRVGNAHTELRWLTAPGQNQPSSHEAGKLKGKIRTLSAPGADVFPFRSAWVPVAKRASSESPELIAAVNGKLKKYVLPATGTRTTGSTTDIAFSASFTLNRKPYQRKQRDYGASSKQALGIVAPALSHAGGSRRIHGAGGSLAMEFCHG